MRNKNVSVGLFVLGGLGLFGAGLFLIGDRRQAFGEHVEYYSEFQDLAGLANGATIRVGGMNAGEVLHIAVPDSLRPASASNGGSTQNCAGWCAEIRLSVSKRKE